MYTYYTNDIYLLEIRAAYSDHIRWQAVHNVIPAAELRGQPHTVATTTPLIAARMKRDMISAETSFFQKFSANIRGVFPF